MSSIRTTFLLRGTALCAMASLALPVASASADSLEDGFRNPPAQARPQVWWHWMSGNVSEEGAMLDLEWMNRVGIGGIHAFSGGGRLEKSYVDKPLPFMSPGWRNAYRTSVEKARSLGMEVTIAGSPGWSQTGGPWVQPADGMKKYVWSEKQVQGGRPVGAMPQPPAMIGPFQAAPRTHGFGPPMEFPQTYGDAALFAFPTPTDEIASKPAYRVNGMPLAALARLPEDLSQSVALPVPPGDAKPVVDLDFGQPRLIRTVTVAAEPLPGFEILASEDGRTFRTVRRVEQEEAEHPAPQYSYAISPVKARILRLQFDRPQHKAPYPGRPIVAAPPPITEIDLHRLTAETAQRVDHFEAKAGFQAVADFTAPPSSTASPASAIDPAKVIDLTGKLRPDGTVDWVPPKGQWTVVRLGWSLTGQVNNPAELSATGLEVDKLDGQAVAAYAAKLFALYEQAGVPIGPRGIGSLLTDSWEAGPQNWTPRMLDEFVRLRGYPAAQWLPVLTGRIVRNATASDAFLFDFRETLKDLVTANHYGVLAKAAHGRGMTYYTEAQGDAPRTISDGLTAKAQSDIPTAEFWYRPFATDAGQPPLIVDLKEAASAAHLYGKPLVAAEAMTVAAGQDPWSFSPAMMKPVADEIFARGVNRILIHDSHHQPFVDRKPGLGLGFFGQYFNRNETWAQDARSFTNYLASTSFLLQQGQAVADIAYFYGEEQSLTQRYHHAFNTDVPRGYGYDYVNPDGLLNRLKVQDGRIVTDSGMNYRLIYLPAYVDRMTAKTAERLEALVKNGAVLVGRKPTGSLGLSDSDSARQAVDRLWGDGLEPVRHVGRGRVHATADLGSVLRAESLAPDVEAPPETDILSTHRRTSDADIYFLSNRSDRPLDGRIRFRSVGTPQLWTADDSQIRPLAFSRRDDGTTDVTLPLEAKGAGFVIFKPSDTKGLEFTSSAAPATVIPLTGPWQVSFEKGRGGPDKAVFPTLIDWSRHDDPRIRYFSGGATYSRSIRIDRAMLEPGRRLTLELGKVHELAVISIDGKDVGTAWKAPYTVDLTGKIGSGVHELKVRVVNLWVNRLIGDAQPGAQPITYAPQSPYKADSTLLPSGLLGPVRLITADQPRQVTR